ncbi:unnamed protein product [Rotaria sp. Silwood2]|nr:unnamed protein product [Rotaria sp. Silwood2]CAF3074040.1 unnamed protein product [Rotaria sp. Silwood2]CAF3444093.1 unnamed protein product [Rotaria sp. Silwood2]CAF4441453.1 unnamed protein product [Rotaria sp. Silwood2]CAF4505577.1 unnamed protein product [Rotaria sp. Silwood2]
MLRRVNDSSKTIPLKQVNVSAKIHAFIADVTITQLFQNEEKTSVEAIYCFPIEENAAVYSFVAKIDDREIVAQLKEKKEAQREYSDALRQGHGAYLLEQDEKSQDCFIINVGALPVGKQCEIKISYVSELELVDDGKKIRFVIPTTIAPRYNPSEGQISSTVAGTTSQYVQSTPYTIEFSCQIDKLGQQLSQVSSSSHSINVDFSHNDFYNVSLSQQSTHLDRDIILDIELSQIRSNTIVAVEKNAIMAVFTPNEEDCKKALGTGADQLSTNEFVFVIDCSGSMEGDKIDAARQAMLLFLKSLPVNCRFNIIRFGSHYQSLFEKKVTAIYNEETMNKAQKMIKLMQADLGEY